MVQLVIDRIATIVTEGELATFAPEGLYVVVDESLEPFLGTIRSFYDPEFDTFRVNVPCVRMACVRPYQSQNIVGCTRYRRPDGNEVILYWVPSERVKFEKKRIPIDA